MAAAKQQTRPSLQASADNAKSDDEDLESADSPEPTEEEREIMSKADKTPPQEPAKKGKTSTYHVPAGAKLFYGGQLLAELSNVELTKAEAEELGDAVTEGKAPEPDSPEKRTAGTYKVAREHTMFHDGQLRGTGYTLKLGAKEAREHGSAIERA